MTPLGRIKKQSGSCGLGKRRWQRRHVCVGIRGGKRSTVRALPALQGHRQVEDGEPWPVREGCGPRDAGRVLPPPLHPPHRATEQGSWDGEGWASQQERDSFPGPPRPGPAHPPLGSPRRGQCPRPGVRSGGLLAQRPYGSPVPG